MIFVNCFGVTDLKYYLNKRMGMLLYHAGLLTFYITYSTYYKGAFFYLEKFVKKQFRI